MKKQTKIFAAAFSMTLALSMTSFAGQWKQDQTGWWYQKDDGTWYAQCWQWIDGNGDGQAECYYFNPEGYLVVNGAADGYTVNADGAWTENGVVQRKSVAAADSTNDSAALAAYIEAQKKNNTLDGMDVVARYMITMAVEENSMDMGMEVNMKLSGAQTGNLKYVMDGTTVLYGERVPYTAFYSDGYVYTDTMGMKVKQAMPLMEALESATSSLDQTSVDTSMIHNLTMRKDGDNTILSYTTDMDYMNAYLNETAEAVNAAGSGFAVSYNMKANSGECVIDKNGYYAKQDMYMDLEMTMTDTETGEAMTIEYRADVYMFINNPGDPVKVTIPSTEGYTDISDMAQ